MSIWKFGLAAWESQFSAWICRYRMYGWPDDWRDDSVSLRWVRNGTDPNVPESVRSLEIDLVES